MKAPQSSGKHEGMEGGRYDSEISIQLCRSFVPPVAFVQSGRAHISARERSKTSYLDSFAWDYPVVYSIVNKLGQRMGAKLEHDRGSMRFHSSDCDLQQRGNLLVRVSPS